MARFFRSIILVFSLLFPFYVWASGSEHHFRFHNSDIHLIWYSEFTSQEKKHLTKWVKSGLNVVRRLNGKLPRNKLRFQLQQRESNRNSPVPYAQVLRDDMPGVHFWVDAKRTYYDLIRDWTFTHELVHLYIDYPGDKDIWLSEGLATYYQNILLVRGGLLTERDFWRRYVEGLNRGKYDSNFDGYPLEAVSEHMRGIGTYMRVYWSGALFFLEANIALWERDKPLLDQLLVTFLACCQSPSQYLKGIELMYKFDELSKTKVFAKLYERYRYVDRMPEFENTLIKLGVEMRGDYLYLDPSNELRRQLLFGR